MVWVRLLGPLEAEVGGVVVGLGGHRQRAVLARLLCAGGEVVSVDRLIDDLWQGAPPPRALTSLRAYVSNLRRALEPDRSARERPQVLVSAPPGYAIRLPDDAIDAGRFEGALRRSRTTGAGQARVLLEEALGLWRGPAYAEFADEPWSIAEAARLAELRLGARELLIDAVLRLGDVAEAVPMAEALTSEQPLREEGWRLLALALWAGGRQAGALAALREARRLLAEETGLDPGPALVRLEDAILAQRMDVLTAVVGVDRPEATPGVRSAPDHMAHRVPDPETAVPGTAVPGAGVPASQDRDDLFIGRAAELAALAETAAQVRDGGSRTVLLTGDAGAGKSALLGRLKCRLMAEGWSVAVGRCPEVEGAPPAWAWVEVLRHLVDRVEGGDPEGRLAPLLAEQPAATGPDAAAGRFLLHRAVCDWLRAEAETGPLAIVIDDLHAADAETLALLAAVAAESIGGMLLVAAYRPAEVDDRLRDALAVLARNAPLRVPLAGWGPGEVARVVNAVCEAPVDEETVSALAERTGGNPFYVWESARLLASEGALVAISEVPEGVKDVLRRRLAGLPKAAVAVLRLAAVAGREADVDVVVAAADTDEAGVMDALDAGLIAGLLVESAPGRVRFTHVLVRDTLYQDLSGLRRARMHARFAAATEELRPGDLPALAHHYARAASPVTARRAVDHAIRAAELAERRYAHDAEIELLTQALEVCHLIPAGTADLDELQVDLLGRLLRAHVRAGAVLAARATRDRAVEIAERAGRNDLLIAAFTAWTVPTPWERRNYGIVDERAVGLLTGLLRAGNLDPAVRCRLLDALNGEFDEGDPLVLAAGEEAVGLARGLDDPDLLALALAAEVRGLTAADQQERRGQAGAELVRLGAGHAMPAYEWLGEHLCSGAALVRNDPEAVREHGARAVRIAATYQLSEPQAVDLCREAVMAHIAGRFDDTERCYRESAGRLRSAGSPHADGFLALAMISLRISRGDIPESERELRALHEGYRSIVLDPLALAAAAAGRPAEARRLHSRVQPIRHDYFHSLFATMRAMTVVALGLREEAAHVHDLLSPECDRLPGAMTASIVMRPVALTLGELDVLLGRTESAARHFARAVDVARAWAAPHWETEAQVALDRVRTGT